MYSCIHKKKSQWYFANTNCMAGTLFTEKTGRLPVKQVRRKVAVPLPGSSDAIQAWN